MQDRHVGGCIYCGGPGPFTDEHVVSAGLGGDDNGWLLKDLVCGVCNTDVFSKLETKFLRSSGPALARLFLQDKGRGRGSKASTPSIDAELTYFHEPNSGTLLVARLIAGGRPITLPQIIARSRGAQAETAVTGGDTDAVGKFLAVLDNLERVRPATADQAAILPSSVFQRPEGQMVCRTTVPGLAVALLSFLRLNPQVRKSEVVAGESEAVERPDIYFRYASDPAIYRRVLSRSGHQHLRIHPWSRNRPQSDVRWRGRLCQNRRRQRARGPHYLGGLAARVGPRFPCVRLVAGEICGGKARSAVSRAALRRSGRVFPPGRIRPADTRTFGNRDRPRRLSETPH